MICDEIDMIGFDAELAGMTEISAEDLQPTRPSKLLKLRGKQNSEISDSFASNYSIDSAKIRGEDSDEEIFETTNISLQK